MKHKRVYKIFGSLALLLALAVLLAGPSVAQGNELTLSWQKRMGLAMGSRSQGLFMLSAKGPEDLASVRFTLDGAELATVSRPPFAVQVNTDNYALGRHALGATALTTGGQTLAAIPIAVEFVSPDTTLRTVGLILAAVLGIAILGSVLPAVLTRQGKRLDPSAPRHYGVEGGAICPKCGRPFARNFFSPNLVVGKLERCPYCGKWSITRRASPAELAAAEAAEAAGARPSVAEAAPEDTLRRQVDDSRYTDY